MKHSLLLSVLCSILAGCARAQSTLDTIGVTALNAQAPTLTGSGVIVAQVESEASPNAFEVTPSLPDQPIKLFTWFSSKGVSSKFPNTVGSDSGHADSVSRNFYGVGLGVAPGVRHVNNYEALFFFDKIIQRQQAITARVVNQSFVLGPQNSSQDADYDNYIAAHHTIIIGGAGNGGAVLTPATCYNGLGVGAYGGSSSTGPTTDGRSKPDITAPADLTSFSTPFVSGAATVLVQAGREQGVNSAAAIDSRTIKALLLNGATKPGDWTHSSTAPLDTRYGAGIVNVFNSWQEQKGGRQAPTSHGFSSGTNHPPLTSGAASAVSAAWDYRAITSTASDQGVSHYRFATSASGALICTLVWDKGYNAASINQLSLYLYNSSGQQLASSVSTVDNVQQIYTPGLGAGTYEIEVVKTAGRTGDRGVAGSREVYSLVWDFDR